MVYKLVTSASEEHKYCKNVSNEENGEKNERFQNIDRMFLYLWKEFVT